jgi:hypothetical protein
VSLAVAPCSSVAKSRKSASSHAVYAQAGPSEGPAIEVPEPTAWRQPNGDWPNAAAVNAPAIVGNTSSATNSNARSFRMRDGTRSRGPSSRCLNEPISNANPRVSSSGRTRASRIGAEQRISGHRGLVAAQAFDQLHRRDDGAGWDLIVVAWHRACLPVR